MAEEGELTISFGELSGTEPHRHRPELCVGGSCSVAICTECGEPLLLDDAGFRPLTGLEFEALPNDVIMSCVASAREASARACGHVPAYVRVMAQLKMAANRWVDEHPPGATQLLRFRLPPEDVYIALLLSDALDKVADGCPHTREFLERLDHATDGQATLTQLRIFVADIGVKADGPGPKAASA